ncbi:MAG: MBL fold metallo-hydrolase [Eggerthellaceae bacterium]|nr:MBL fold metallo-hydrolase [Eggerthellaceae bacterium]
MKVTVLSENTTKGPKVTPEFGLSLHVECGGQSILFDAGSGGNFARNAQALGIDLSQVDSAVLSHGHFDHANGFGTFIEMNDHAPIYAHEGFDGDIFKKPDEYIGIAAELKGNSRFEVVSESREIGEGLVLLSYDSATSLHPIESGDMCVKGEDGMRPDDFSHEHYLLACEGDVRLLVTGCSHKGIANIMAWAKAQHVTHVIGGFHLMGVQSGEFGKLDGLADELLAYGAMYYTGHCTGIEQYAYLKSRMGNKVCYAGTGDVLAF